MVKVTQRELLTRLVHLWKEGGIKELGRFINDNAYAAGVTNLPESYKPPEVREELERDADRAGWPR